MPAHVILSPEPAEVSAGRMEFGRERDGLGAAGALAEHAEVRATRNERGAEWKALFRFDRVKADRVPTMSLYSPRIQL
jgi:hypothetical protein